MNSYATMLKDGDGVEASQADAARYYKMAADKGNASSMYNYEHLLRNGEGVKTNKKEAIRYYKMSKGNDEAIRYKMSADKGNVKAKSKLAEISSKRQKLIV